jgi:hypothetical protein
VEYLRSRVRGRLSFDLIGSSPIYRRISSVIDWTRSHCLVRKPVEGDDGLFEMLFFRVLDLVVADAVEALDEHHDGRDAEAGDFGGVMERAGGKAMGDGAGLETASSRKAMSKRGRSVVWQRA